MITRRQSPSWLHNTRLEAVDSFCWGVEYYDTQGRSFQPYKPPFYGGLSYGAKFILYFCLMVSLVMVLWSLISLSQAGF